MVAASAGIGGRLESANPGPVEDLVAEISFNQRESLAGLFIIIEFEYLLWIYTVNAESKQIDEKYLHSVKATLFNEKIYNANRF